MEIPLRLKNTIALVVLFLSGFSLPVMGNSMDNHFCEGYKAGYTAGYEQTAGQPPVRMSPLCPLKPPDTPANEKAEFDRGYDTGFKAGVRDGSR